MILWTQTLIHSNKLLLNYTIRRMYFVIRDLVWASRGPNLARFWGLGGGFWGLGGSKDLIWGSWGPNLAWFWGLGGRFFGFGRVWEPHLGVLGGWFWIFWGLGGRFWGLGGSNDLILGSWGQFWPDLGIFLRSWGPFWGLGGSRHLGAYFEDSKDLPSHLNDKAEYLCTFKIKPEFVTLWSPCK